MPETTRIACVSAGIGVGPPAPQQRLQFFAVGSAEAPDERGIDDPPPADHGVYAAEPVAERANEPAAESSSDREQSDDHRCGREKLSQQAGGSPPPHPADAS